MKKSLIFLPLAVLALVGCGEKDGSASGAAPTAPSAGPVIITTGGQSATPVPVTPVDVNSFTVNFQTSEIKDGRVTPYIDGSDLKNFEYAGFTWNDVACYASAPYGTDSNYYLMMGSKKYTCVAFVGNHQQFVKNITKVKVVTNGESASASMEVAVKLGTSEFLTGAEAGGASQVGTGKEQTIEVTADASAGYHYFCVASTKTSANAQILSIEVTLA